VVEKLLLRTVQPASMPSQSTWSESWKHAVHILRVFQQVRAASNGCSEEL